VDACISGHIKLEHVITCTFGCTNGEMHVESFSDDGGIASIGTRVIERHSHQTVDLLASITMRSPLPFILSLLELLRDLNGGMSFL
jgi:hypothetical protein